VLSETLVVTDGLDGFETRPHGEFYMPACML